MAGPSLLAMSKRRDVMRIGGWLALIWGVASVLLAMATDLDWADLAGGYGLLLALTGGWTVAGLAFLGRHEQRMAQAKAANLIVTNRQGAVSR
jgi:hypothetical protein